MNVRGSVQMEKYPDLCMAQRSAAVYIVTAVW